MSRRWHRWLAPLLLAALAGTPAGAAQPGPARAHVRGVLVVGVPHVAPEPAPGAKIRTPGRLDAAAAQRLAERLGLPVRLQAVQAAQAAGLLRAGEVDVVLADRLEGQSLPGSQEPGVAVVPAGYATRPQAVIRSDTPMRRWQDVAGRSVCMAADAEQARAWAERWQAQVQVHRVPSDALVAVREGRCDVGLVDDTVWAPLMRFPEWKKFAATLPVEGPRAQRVWLAPEADAAWLQAEMRRWRREGVWEAMAGQWARDVAFDVYLDQEVPDCHG
ncbi:type 2 periplasmic-binding domain-containing protein [Bordetella sp. 2513F-2]